MIAVVTGAGRGIGRAIALELADRGCDIALLCRSFGDHKDASAPAAAAALGGGSDVAGEIVRRGRRALSVPCDVSRAADVEHAKARVLDELGVPGVVVANAGIVHRASVLEMTETQWDEVIDVNLKGTFLVVRAFLAPMLAERKGRFIAIGSISGTMGTPRQSAYCASKWGTVGFVKSLAEELRGTGLQAMCVMPGSVDTDMLRGSGFSPAMQPADVAKIVGYLTFDAPPAMNGSCVEAFGP